jgi:hypothetical protein
MKKLLPIIVCFVFALQIKPFAQSGANAFNTQFNNSATNLDMKNAYLMGYLSTACYADYIRYLYNPVLSSNSTLINSIRDDDEKFIVEYSKKLSYLFTSTPLLNPIINANRILVKPGILTEKITSASTAAAEPAVTFDMIHRCNPIGYDPEAILISTPTTIYVVFRGTDRVACNVTHNGYEWAEWLSTDFKFLKRDASFLNAQVKGQVHRGMAESLVNDNFADELGSSIAALIRNKTTGATKKVWISGHSLGGGHAQLFAMFLKYNYNITAQGLYLYESPHPGDAAFVAQLNNDIGKNRIQRFEFGDDPICTLPPQVFFYGRAGVRNYFKDYTSAVQAGEQIAALDDLRILCALGNLPGEQIPQTAKLQFPPLCPGSTCFHHPTMVLQAIRHQLSSAALSSLPEAIPLPLAGDNCNQGDLTKAENNDLPNNVATAIENTIADVAWQAGNMLDNLLGTGIPEGTYKIACYGFKNNDKKYLKWDGTVNHQLNISSTGTIFNITHKLTGGYQIWSFAGNMAADVKFSFGLPTGEENTNNVLMKSKDIVIGDEETWYFFKVPNKTNTYVLYNWNSHKVLDAPDNCLTVNSCPVNEKEGKSNTPTQVWILEKSN